MSDAGKWIKVWDKAVTTLEKEWTKSNPKADFKKIMAPAAKVGPAIKQTDKVIVTSAIAGKDIRPKFAVPMRKAWKVCDRAIGDFQKALKKSANEDPAKAKAGKASDVFNKEANRILAEMVTELAELEEALDSLEKIDPKDAASLKAVKKAGVRTLGNTKAWAGARMKEDTVETYNAGVDGMIGELIAYADAALKNLPKTHEKAGKPVAKIQGDLKKLRSAAVVPNDAAPKDVQKRLALLVGNAQKLVKTVSKIELK